MELSNFIAYEQGNLDFGATLEFFAELIETGQAWQLQGHYGRTASALIRQGLISKQGKINNDIVNEFLTQ